MPPISILSGALTRALNHVNRARNQVGSLHFYTTPADPDIHGRVTDAYNRIAQAEGILEALRDDLAVWRKEDTHAEPERSER
jgi:hypothetical protein